MASGNDEQNTCLNMIRNTPISPELLRAFGRLAIAFARAYSLDPHLVYSAALWAARDTGSSVTLSSLRESLTLDTVGRYQFELARRVRQWISVLPETVYRAMPERLRTPANVAWVTGLIQAKVLRAARHLTYEFSVPPEALAGDHPPIAEGAKGRAKLPSPACRGQGIQPRPWPGDSS